MLVSYAWLNEWVQGVPPVDALADALTRGGLEVEAVTPAAPPLADAIVVGQIIGVTPHPNSSKLRVCEVDVGAGRNLDIVCGAANARANLKVAVAKVGAKLGAEPNDLRIAERDIVGVKSAGMICSAAELGLEDSSDGIMELDADAVLGTPVRQQLGLEDSIIALELTPNRGDCLGMLGIAREVCALTDAKLRRPYADWARGSGFAKTFSNTSDKTATQLTVELRAPKLCPRYVGRVIRAVDVARPTPDWLRERLRRAGVRSLGLAVDITNYVMLELGQPLHAFDWEKLVGGIIVRTAQSGEKLALLNGSNVTLQTSDLVIADQQKAVALAGIMGGADSAVSESTQHILLEAAFFPAHGIQGKARRFGLHTDASHRFERGVDPRMQQCAIARASELLVALGGGTAEPMCDAQAREFRPQRDSVAFAPSEVSRALGVEVPANKVRGLLKKLGMTLSATKSGWDVGIPSWRSDISGAHDLVEEVGRVYGFDNIPPRPPTATARAGRNAENAIGTTQVRQKMVERGYFEAITYSFVEPAAQHALTEQTGISLRNPIADNLAEMRRSLLPGLANALSRNLNRQHERVRLFEIGNVFLDPQPNAAPQKSVPKSTPKAPPQPYCREVQRIAALATGAVLPKQWGAAARGVDFFDLKGDLLALLALRGGGADSGVERVEFEPAASAAWHPGRSAKICVDGKSIGFIGQLHPLPVRKFGIAQEIYGFELDLAHLTRAILPAFTPFSRYPVSLRDLAVVVDAQVSAQAILKTLKNAATTGNFLRDVRLFDVYAGDGVGENEKSFAFSLTFQADFANLTAEQVECEVADLVARLKKQFGARLRT